MGYLGIVKSRFSRITTRFSAPDGINGRDNRSRQLEEPSGESRLILALLADRLHALLALMADLPPDVLRISGIVSAGLGLLFVWLLRA